MRSSLILVLCVVVLCPGCQIGGIDTNTEWTPEAKLVAAREAFNGTVRTLTLLRMQGAFTEPQAERIGATLHMAAILLDQWQADVLARADATESEAAFDAVYAQLQGAVAATRKESP